MGSQASLSYQHTRTGLQYIIMCCSASSDLTWCITNGYVSTRPEDVASSSNPLSGLSQQLQCAPLAFKIFWQRHLLREGTAELTEQMGEREDERGGREEKGGEGRRREGKE